MLLSCPQFQPFSSEQGVLTTHPQNLVLSSGRLVRIKEISPLLMNSCPQFRPYWFGSRFPFSLTHEMLSLVLTILVRIKEYICMKSHLRFSLLVGIKEYAHHEITPLGSAFLVRIEDFTYYMKSRSSIFFIQKSCPQFRPFGSNKGCIFFFTQTCHVQGTYKML